MDEKKKLIVAGFARHGKDTFCEFLKQIAGYDFVTSSLAASDVVFAKIGAACDYKNAMECWEDRVNHRAEWYDIITAYNTPDKSRLGKLIFSKFNIYCGIRNIDEFRALKEKGIFDLAIWVDASSRMPPESRDSITISREDCDLTIDNNGSPEELKEKAAEFCRKYLI